MNLVPINKTIHNKYLNRTYILKMSYRVGLPHKLNKSLMLMGLLTVLFQAILMMGIKYR